VTLGHGTTGCCPTVELTLQGANLSLVMDSGACYIMGAKPLTMHVVYRRSMEIDLVTQVLVAIVIIHLKLL
jgi:hypothetical protein